MEVHNRQPAGSRRHMMMMIQEQLRDIPNVIVYGTTWTEHDNTLCSAFQRSAEKGLTLNKGKCLFNQSKRIVEQS